MLEKIKSLILFMSFTVLINALQAQTTLEYSQALIVSNINDTVPSGKVWKVTAIYGTCQQCMEIGPCYTALSPTSYGFTWTSGFYLNGTMITSRISWIRSNFYTDAACSANARNFITTGSCDSMARDVASDPNILPMWLPSGTIVKSLGATTYVSVLEFNII